MRHIEQPSIKSAFEEVAKGWLLLAEQMECIECQRFRLPAPKARGTSELSSVGTTDRLSSGADDVLLQATRFSCAHHRRV
jgi:hypothetical protein